LGVDVAIKAIAAGLDEILKTRPQVHIALETMSGKGTEVGTTFSQLARIIDQTPHNDNLSVTLDTCHLNDAGYDVKQDFDGVLREFDQIIGLQRLAMIHLNDSKNPLGAHKDRHANIGFGTIGFAALNYVCHHPQLTAIPKIMETPYVPLSSNPHHKQAPYLEEIKMLRAQKFDKELLRRLSIP
ncbi:deoxyribonuclease IV, partial [Lactobacillus sp. XV13L]|nr:deoxyribonuclease IV [Lactobacillus sp. XV13L]